MIQAYKLKHEPQKGYDDITSTIDKMSDINLSGNMIPQSWFSNITYSTKTRENIPYIEAIIILSDICYWYRKTEIRDENSGKIIRYQKKFQYDMLQRSYESFSEQFGFSKQVTMEAIHFLEAKALIVAEFRHFKPKDGSFQSNLLFLAPIPEEIKKITNNSRIKKKNFDIPHLIPPIPTQTSQSYPETTTENTVSNNIDLKKSNECNKTVNTNTDILSISYNNRGFNKESVSAPTQHVYVPRVPTFDLNDPDHPEKQWLAVNRIHRRENDITWLTSQPSICEFLYEAEVMSIDFVFAKKAYHAWSRHGWKQKGSKRPITNWVQYLQICYKIRKDGEAEIDANTTSCACGQKYVVPLIDEGEDATGYKCPRCGRPHKYRTLIN